MRIRVEVWRDVQAMAAATIRLEQDGEVSIEDCDGFIRAYYMNHNDDTERRTLGAQCRNAFEGGQCIVTYRS